MIRVLNRIHYARRDDGIGRIAEGARGGSRFSVDGKTHRTLIAQARNSTADGLRSGVVTHGSASSRFHCARSGGDLDAAARIRIHEAQRQGVGKCHVIRSSGPCVGDVHRISHRHSGHRADGRNGLVDRHIRAGEGQRRSRGIVVAVGIVNTSWNARTKPVFDTPRCKPALRFHVGGGHGIHNGQRAAGWQFWHVCADERRRIVPAGHLSKLRSRGTLCAVTGLATLQLGDDIQAITGFRAHQIVRQQCSIGRARPVVDYRHRVLERHAGHQHIGALGLGHRQIGFRTGGSCGRRYRHHGGIVVGSAVHHAVGGSCGERIADRTRLRAAWRCCAVSGRHGVGDGQRGAHRKLRHVHAEQLRDIGTA